MTVSHLVRRGVDAVSTLSNDQDVPVFDVEVGSPFLAGLLVVTVIGFTVVMFCVEYTYGLLVPTLAAVEDSNPEFYIRVENDPNSKPAGNSTDVEMEVATAPPAPITSKLRTTIRHLRSRGGRCSPFRGFSMFFANLAAGRFLTSLLSMPTSSIFVQLVMAMVSHILLANLHVAWIHIVISEPSRKRFYQRIPSFRSLKKIVPAASLQILVELGAFYIDALKHYGKTFGIMSIGLLLAGLACVPANVIFVRVAASMLPDEDEAIVPFDRSFGGRVDPEVVGGGVLSIADAWKTFDRDGWKRYIMAHVKAMGIQVGVTMLFSVVIAAELLGGALTLPVVALDIPYATPPPVIAMATTAAGRMLARQLQQMQSDKDIPGISCGLVDNNVFEWEVMLMISDDVKLYGGGFFRARLSFPPEYPHMPPKMKFESPLFHPNIYPNGEVCISILHPPEEDKYGYESAAERWSPVQTPETILLSVISMLSSPNDESPANVEAARLWREDPKEFKKRVRKCVRDSLGEE
ncbi:hypothetical protein BJX61DRAFT_552205 [Aspergillus egyptiacus]|nr:hypothetical protein BJX61DRAFT_552205 [Aspergillus egyptiacus]